MRLPKLSTYSDAPSIDGEYNSARLLPEMTSYGSAQLTSAKFFGTAGMDSLRAILKHANKYGLKYIFVHDPFYEPLLVFAGWHQIEVYDGGTITVWSKDDVPPAHKFPSDAMPAPWEGTDVGNSSHRLRGACSVFPDCLPDRKRKFQPEYLSPSGRLALRPGGPVMSSILGIVILVVDAGAGGAGLHAVVRGRWGFTF